jgi:Ca2+-dependent lipid-binding protein
MDTFGKSDPYCKAFIRGRSTVVKTPVIENTNAPKWNVSFNLEVLAYGTDILAIQMYDKDVASDDKMGKLNIRLSLLPPGQLVDSWYPLNPTKKCKKPGEIRLTLQVVLRGAPDTPLVPFQPLIARLTIAEAKDLAKMDTVGKSDPFCVVNLLHSPSVFKTTVKNNTLSPVWNETTEFTLTNPLFDIIHILVKDKDVASDDEMATLDVPLAKFCDLKINDSWYSLVPVKGVKKGGQIRIVIQITQAPPVAYSTTAPGSIGKASKK